MAHKKAGGSTRNGRDSNPQYRGVKLYGGQFAKAGAIIVRQCGTKFHPGFNVGMGKVYTIFSKVPDDNTMRPATNCQAATHSHHPSIWKPVYVSKTILQ